MIIDQIGTRVSASRLSMPKGWASDRSLPIQWWMPQGDKTHYKVCCYTRGGILIWQKPFDDIIAAYRAKNDIDEGRRPLEFPSVDVEVFTYVFTVTSFTSPGAQTWTVPGFLISVSYVVVAGGGSGGTFEGGGGGAGGFKSGTNFTTVPYTGYSVTVGAGGNEVPKTTVLTNGAQGATSAFTTVSCTGGGFGAAGGSGAGGAGGSGGGAGGNNAAGAAGGAGTAGQGFAGGLSANYGGTSYVLGAGGGGALQTGSIGTFLIGGAGGNGTTSNITGAIVTYAGGGGGGCVTTAVVGGAGGSGGGGAGATTTVAAGSGVANTGGGGGGGYNDGANGHTTGAGGSGIVIVSFTINPGIFGNAPMLGM